MISDTWDQIQSLQYDTQSFCDPASALLSGFYYCFVPHLIWHWLYYNTQQFVEDTMTLLPLGLWTTDGQ